ncbi:hypothetical protein J5N97_003311 [Dioscorea zingiberensis]|uniref:Vacuolar import/degradation Vid27 C-terminal domain-containing protein n=1 Tax=Dioscorea zingiberensis TaxID=325984 RepID=A0A9D5D6G2_9LILI|nr:hypothetical protein J5N97_003311 [Dioscorea zingiberensis]
MGGSHSREGLNLSDAESESESEEYQEAEEEEEEEEKQQSDLHRHGSASKTRTPTSVEELDAKLQSLKLNSPSAKWITSEKLTFFSFSKPESDDDEAPSASPWFLTVGAKIKARVGPELQLKPFPAQRRVDFVADGVWALKFFSIGSYHGFLNEYQNCLFENIYNLEANDANKVRVFGNDFLGWAKPDAADDTIWEDAEEGFEKSPRAAAARGQDLLEEFEEDAGNCGGIQSLALGALDNSFLVSDSGVQVLKNFSHGVHGKGVSETPKKAVLKRGETNMLLMSPATTGKPQSTGVHQLDIETGKVVTEWKFEKDGTDITMRDITNDSKGGIVQNLANSMESPVLQWTQGHQFSRGTNFQCFASTGDGSIVVGSIDGKIRLYSKSSMRMAKTAFPGLGSPITHVDVTYDGRWILGTTDTYLILICTIFKDKDGKEKTGFSGRMGNRIAAPRLLKLTPLDSHLAGKNNKFQRGQFSWVTENGKQERHLVATVGKFSIIWNFQQVKNSRHECYLNQEGLKSCYCYKIVPKDESIVDSRFMHEKFAATSDSPEAPLVVVTPMKVSSFSLSNRR